MDQMNISLLENMNV